MKNVLIVEDQRMARESMESYIRKSGQYRLVDSIANAALAEMCCTSQPVDLVLMDVCTENDESGFEALMGPSGSGKSTFLHIAAGLLAVLSRIFYPAVLMLIDRTRQRS